MSASTARMDAIEGESELLKLVGFRIDDWRFAVRLAQVQTSIMPCQVTRLWHVPPFVSGIISLRGTIVCVLDLGRLLGLSGSAGAHSRLLVVRDSGVQAAIPVHEVFRVPDIPQHIVEPPPQGMDPAHREIVEGVINISRLPQSAVAPVGAMGTAGGPRGAAPAQGDDPEVEIVETGSTITLMDVAMLLSCAPVRALRGAR